MEIKVMDKVLAANDAWAAENRKFLKEKNITMLNLIGSPGAGKTTLLEKTIDSLKETLRIGIIEGDIATTKDAERIKQKEVPVFQINTGAACHLDAHLVNTALKELLKDNELNLIIVENVGNLVCPAEFDIGEKDKIAILSVTEGDDKIDKYPLLFSEARALIISKIELLAYTNFDLDTVLKSYHKLKANPLSFQLDSLSEQGFDPWLNFVKEQIN